MVITKKAYWHYLEFFPHHCAIHPDDLDTYHSILKNSKYGLPSSEWEYRADYFKTGYHWYRIQYKTVNQNHTLIGIGQNIDGEKNQKQTT